MNIQKDTKAILSGEYKQFHRAWLFSLFLIIYFFLPIPVAAWTGNFNGGNFNEFTGWSTNNVIITSGVGSLDGSAYLVGDPTFGVATIYKNGLSGISYWEITARNNHSTAQIGFNFKNSTTSSNQCRVLIKATSIKTDGVGSCAALTDINFVSVPGRWYKITIEDLTSTYLINIYDAQNATLVQPYTITAIHPSDSDSIQVTNYNGLGADYVGIDNIVANTVSPTSSNSISWGSQSYVPLDSGSYTWTVAQSDWDDTFAWIHYSFRAELYKDNTIIQAFDIGTQTGTGYYTFPDVGTYQLKLNKYYILPVSSSSNILANNSIVVRSAGTAYLTGVSYAATYTDTNYTYSFGVGGITRPAIAVSYADPATGNPVSESLFIISGTAPSTLPAGTIPLNFKREALYTLKLKDISTGKFYASPFTVQTYFEAPPSTQNISTSSITLDRSSYYYGQQMIAQWKVDNVNFTAPNQTYLDIYNIDSGIVTGETWSDDGYWRCASGAVCQIGVGQASSNYWILIQNSMFDVAQRYWQSGNNQIRLMKYNKGTNSKTVLAFANFTLTGTNSAGYGLEVVPNPVKLGDQIMINTTVPAGITTASLTILNGDGSATIWNPNWNLVSGSQTLTYKFKKEGSYIIGVFNGNGTNQTLQIQVVITVSAVLPKATATTTPTTPTTSQTTQQTTALVDLLSSNLFWALIFTVGMMTMIAFATMKREKEQ